MLTVRQSRQEQLHDQVPVLHALLPIKDHHPPALRIEARRGMQDALADEVFDLVFGEMGGKGVGQGVVASTDGYGIEEGGGMAGGFAFESGCEGLSGLGGHVAGSRLAGGWISAGCFS